MADPKTSIANVDAITGDQSGLLAMLKPIGHEISWPKGKALFTQGDPARNLFALVKGCLEVSVMSRSGRKMALNIIGENQIFGEIALFGRCTRTATVTALSESRILRVTSQRLIAAMHENSDLALELLRMSVGRSQWVSAQLEDHAFASLNVRLARRLLYLMHTIGDTDGCVPVAQHELGNHVGASREAVSKILAHWKRKAIVEPLRGRIIVRAPDKLETLAALGAI